MISDRSRGQPGHHAGHWRSSLHIRDHLPGVQPAPQAGPSLHLFNRKRNIRPGGRQVDGLWEQGLLHPRHHPGGGQGAGAEVHPSDGPAAGSLQRDSPCQVDRSVRRYWGKLWPSWLFTFHYFPIKICNLLNNKYNLNWFQPNNDWLGSEWTQSLGHWA